MPRLRLSVLVPAVVASIAFAVGATAHRSSAASSGNTIAPFTMAQAHAGAAVYTAQCLGCHGYNLQGVSAPAVAGKSFIKTVTFDKWTVGNLHDLVTQQMPLNNPGTLSPKQYADVIAYILASNCYTAGSKPFPEHGSDPSFAKRIVAPSGKTPTNASTGTCAVK